MLASAKIPKPTNTAPDTLLTILNDPRFNLGPRSETPPLSTSHQRAEPRITPATIHAADARQPVLASPRPAKTAAKERIVIGFVIVKKTVEA
jgi:hypothetical protein